MSSPRVTVGLPFVKDANLLADAVRSVLAQTLSDWELILVDDGATEECVSLAQSIRDPRVRFIREDCQNRGQAYRRNQIARLARGNYLAVMDADDLMHPERLQRQLHYLDHHPEADAVSTDTFVINIDNQVVGKRTSLSMGGSIARVLKGRHVHHPTVTARTDWFRHNPYDPTLRRCEDRDLWCRTCTNSVFGHLPELLFFYRQGEVNVRNYVNNYCADYSLLRRYGLSSLGLTATIYRMLLLRLKSLAYRGFGVVKAQSVLAHWYSEPLLPQETLTAAEILHNILRTPLSDRSSSIPQKRETEAPSAEELFGEQVPVPATSADRIIW